MPLDSSRYFPPAWQADEDGLLAVGGCLDPDWLLDAYSHGIFPWPMGERRCPITWFSPDPRAIIPFDTFHVSRRLLRTCRAGRFHMTCNRAFSKVMVGCATAPGRVGETWITKAMLRAYQRLHALGHAHSVEAWRDERLVGGVYGVAIGGLFAAESMFHAERDASKVALVHLVHHLQARGFALLDIQMLTPHTASFGAVEISRVEYLARLKRALVTPTTFGECLSTTGAGGHRRQ